MKGRKPKLRLVDDEFSPPIPGLEAPLGPCPPPPKWLSDHSKREWRRTAPILHKQGRLADSLFATFEAYCVAVGAVREAEETLIVSGRYVTTIKGTTLHPAFKVQMAAMREVRMLAAELRLTRELAADGEDKGDGADAVWHGLLS